VAGILVARIGEGWCFFANAVSYIAVIIGCCMMKFISPARALWHLRWSTSWRDSAFVQPHRADPGVADAVGSGESGGDAPTWY